MQQTLRRIIRHAAVAIQILALAGVAAGSIFSALDLCTGACSEAHLYRLFGFEFWQPGVVFTVLLMAGWWYRNKGTTAGRAYTGLVLLANGMEVFFLHIQKNIIGAWCPICVAIAVSLGTLLAVRIYEAITYKSPEAVGDMNKNCKYWLKWAIGKLTPVALIYAGLCIAVAGVSKAEPPLPNVWLGDAKSATEIYFISDWFCPYCKKIEQDLPHLVSTLGQKHRITFVDLPIHQDSFNYIPAHITLLVNHKDKYMSGRKALASLAALNVGSPDETLVAKEMKKIGIDFHMADFYSISRVTNSYSNFIRSSGASITPSIVVRNSKNGKKKLLQGAEAYKDAVINKAIQEVS